MGPRESAVDRRTFLLASLAAAIPNVAQTPRLETLTDWLKASPSAREQARASLADRVRAQDVPLQAWVQIQPEAPTGTGPLAGIPFGVKDVFETKGLATEYGSPIYKGRLGTVDAEIVRQLRQLGGVMLGKTQCAAFAYKTPPPTRNPRNLEHTPGGSSSGSAAAVAAGMVPLALGTQTMGSVLRPASFCGIAGFKPSYGVISTAGVLEVSKTLDTVGFFTHTAADMLALWESIGQPSGRVEEFALGVPDPLPNVDAPMALAFRAAIDRLRRAGIAIKAIDIADSLNRLHDAAQTLQFYEGARVHEARYREYGARLLDLADLVRDGLQMPASQYQDALTYISAQKARFVELFKATPAILTPAAVGPAPLGLASTGDSRMDSPWTALSTPAISIPMPVGSELPLGLQICGGVGQDARVIRTAMRIEQLL